MGIFFFGDAADIRSTVTQARQREFSGLLPPEAAVFARSDFTRTLYAVLPEASEPLSMRTIAIRMVAAKGLDTP